MGFEGLSNSSAPNFGRYRWPLTSLPSRACIKSDQHRILKKRVREGFSPLRRFSKEHWHTVLEHYLFKGTGGTMLLALGVGSLFNHARKPNLDYRIDDNQPVIRYFAARNIMAEEELTIFYGDKLWFEDTSIVKEQIAMTSGLSDINMSHEHMDDENTFLGHMTL
ncbi:hypothetical protein WJX79_006823 [Trebouxia sp. C0005]